MYNYFMFIGHFVDYDEDEKILYIKVKGDWANAPEQKFGVHLIDALIPTLDFLTYYGQPLSIKGRIDIKNYNLSLIAERIMIMS